MLIARSAQSLNKEIATLRTRGGARRCIAMVIASGPLHQGHGALLNAANTISDVLVTIILPMPPNETLSDEIVHSVDATDAPDNVVTAGEFHDIGFVEQHSTDLLYLPCADEIFPDDATNLFTLRTPKTYLLPGQVEHTVDRQMTTHVRLLNNVQPDIFLWGEKKFAEYYQVRSLVADLGIQTQMQCIPTVRHANGLAVGNVEEQLSDEQREIAPILHETLNNAAHAIRTGARHFDKLGNTARLALREAGFTVQQFDIFDQHTMRDAQDYTTSFRIMAQVSLAETILRDNIGLTL